MSADAPPFRGFMAEVWKSESELALGRFVEFGPGSAGLACNGITVSASPNLLFSLLNENNVCTYRSYNLPTAVTLYRPGSYGSKSVSSYVENKKPSNF